jgi:acetyl esterase/lipase
MTTPQRPQHSTFSYLYHKTLVSIARFVFSFSNPPPAQPDDTYTFNSRDKTRDITVNIYRPKSPKTPSPVLLNWHGSGFVFHWHGTDDRYCRYVADNTDYTVLDASYALSPEYPFPAALEDVEDLVISVLEKPQEYDQRDIVLSGFSAGANLLLGVLADQKSQVPNEKIRAIITFYPPTDLSIMPEDKRAPDGSPGSIPAAAATLFNGSYMPKGTDPKDPCISPRLADLGAFPDNILMITAGKDNLAGEGEDLARKCEDSGKKNVVMKRVEGVQHAWDKDAKEGTLEAGERDNAYALAVKFLKDLHE